MRFNAFTSEKPDDDLKLDWPPGTILPSGYPHSLTIWSRRWSAHRKYILSSRSCCSSFLINLFKSFRCEVFVQIMNRKSNSRIDSILIFLTLFKWRMVVGSLGERWTWKFTKQNKDLLHDLSFNQLYYDFLKSLRMNYIIFKNKCLSPDTAIIPLKNSHPRNSARAYVRDIVISVLKIYEVRSQLCHNKSRLRTNTLFH